MNINHTIKIEYKNGEKVEISMLRTRPGALRVYDAYETAGEMCYTMKKMVLLDREKKPVKTRRFA